MRLTKMAEHAEATQLELLPLFACDACDGWARVASVTIKLPLINAHGRY